MAALRSGDPAEVGPLLSNDLQPAAVSLRPDLRRTLNAGTEHGALGAHRLRVRPDLRVPGRERRAGAGAGGGADRRRGVPVGAAGQGPGPGRLGRDHGAPVTGRAR